PCLTARPRHSITVLLMQYTRSMSSTRLPHLRSPRSSRDDAPALSPMDRPIEGRILTPWRLAAAAGALALLAISAYAYVELGYGRTLRVEPARLTFSTVAHGVFREYIPLTGQIVPRTTVYLDAVEGGQ